MPPLYVRGLTLKGSIFAEERERMKIGERERGREGGRLRLGEREGDRGRGTKPQYG